MIDGLTRDVHEIEEIDFPVFAVGQSPVDSEGRCEGIEWGQPIDCAGARVAYGDVIAGDDMGVVVVPARRRKRCWTEPRPRDAVSPTCARFWPPVAMWARSSRNTAFCRSGLVFAPAAGKAPSCCLGLPLRFLAALGMTGWGGSE